MINFLFWNIRGVSRAPNFRRLKYLVHHHSIQLVAICEPKIQAAKIHSIRMRLNMDHAVFNIEGDIWVFYNSSISCSLVGESCQHLSLQISSALFELPIIFSFVHAKCTALERVQLWNSLIVDKLKQSAWFIVGDINVIVSAEEKRGGMPFRPEEGWDFLDFMSQAGIFDVWYSGSSFTWCNNRHGRARI